MGADPEGRTPLTDLLVERIGREGPLTFAAFMEACLYHPQHGYYTQWAKREADYFTSPEVEPLFGRLLARQLAEMWDAMGRPERFAVVECGGGRGHLAEQILAAVAEQTPRFSAALRVAVVEISQTRREQAKSALARFGERARVADALPADVTGCVLSNELLDALPVHRVVQRAEGLREIYVSAREGRLVEEEGEPSSPAIASYLEQYGVPLAEGQHGEVHLAALVWLGQVAAALVRGFLLTIDYGHRARELYGPGHQRGTLLTYRRHRVREDWLAQAGDQDLTAHVNFTALEERGQELGLETLGLTTQANFLLSLARTSDFVDVEPPGAGEKEKLGTRQAFKLLIHPEGMGETFKVLVQAKNVPGARLAGLQPL